MAYVKKIISKGKVIIRNGQIKVFKIYKVIVTILGSFDDTNAFESGN